MFATSVRDNLTYGLKHRPLVPPDYDEAAKAEREKWEIEAGRAGNSTDDQAADWHDYDAAGIAGDEDLTPRALDVLRSVDMEPDIYELGLRGTIDPLARPELAASILDARASFRDRLARGSMLPASPVMKI